MVINQNIAKLLQDSGYKLTRQRRVIIEVLSKNERPLTALELYHQVKDKIPTISQDTLYRNLEVLSFIGVANRIRVRGGDRFELVQQHHHHFICLKCGEVKCLKGCPIGPGQLAEARKNDLEVLFHNFELSGYCDKCRSCQKEG
ncbi:transcriptional repressor [Desulfallas sp. Bu1-1]|uniref:Fur family transcriptional regulator n=1 Tax=Desulfallas sp. Bu1-1 TaxID=2787620 RepID=UPI00189D1925|nr:Fur family transcriptional regulator [Desulfallas sp. Bu1-1]MBF7084477.1 transcriptional repressor [Desulfallas sp. Bu1-1]